MKELFSLFAVFLALFLFGMVVMRTGFVHTGQTYIQNILHRLTNSPWKGLLVGAFATALLQSSSAILVITVGLVATGLLTFQHSIGIILGANIGTTITTQMIALHITDFIIPLLLIGLLFLLLPYTYSYAIGCLFFGLACIFIAMDGLATLAHPIATIPMIHTFFTQTNEQLLLGVGVGAVLTAIIQSSTATTAIAMGFLNDNMLSLHASIAIMLGANIGTCITALLASIGTKESAKLVAYANIWLNVFGVVICIPFIQLLSHVVSQLTTMPMMQLAHASVIFNVACSLLILPFVPFFTRFVKALHAT